MFICTKCAKEFKYESELNRHNNRKTKCNKIKDNLKCNICNRSFVRTSHKIAHEKTKKHINNYNKCNIQNNIHGDNIQNIINLTLSVKTFKETDLSYLRNWIINDIGNELYTKTMAKSYLCIQDKVKLLFHGTLEILEFLHFNLTNDDNHNCKILLMFPGIKKQVYEYLILDIDTNTKKLLWNSLQYSDFIREILNHLTRINNITKNNNFSDYIKYLNTYLLDNSKTAHELKSHIEKELGNLYIKFNIEQKKQSRPIKVLFNEKLKEYIEYRKEECKLNNGYIPDINNSNI
jgi:hypothetical protein